MSRGAVLLVASVLASCGGAPSLPPSTASPLLTKPMPRVQRAALGGERIDSTGLTGRPVVVKFFAEYCEPCKHTLPAAERAHQDYPGVAFIGVSLDERRSTAQRLAQAYSLTFPVIHDSGNVLAGRFRVSEMPVTFVADAQGVIRWVGGPEQSEDDLEQALDAVAR